MVRWCSSECCSDRVACVRWGLAICNDTPAIYYCDDKLFDAHGRKITALEISTGEEYSSGSQLCDVCVLAILRSCPNLLQLKLPSISSKALDVIIDAYQQQTTASKCKIISLEMFVDDGSSVLRLTAALADPRSAIAQALTSKLTIVDFKSKGTFSTKNIAAYTRMLHANRTLRALEMAIGDNICVADTMFRSHYGEALTLPVAKRATSAFLSAVQHGASHAANALDTSLVGRILDFAAERTSRRVRLLDLVDLAEYLEEPCKSATE
ncbi:hypothetical protein FI667_g13249, partial [Globisporangium splendens]